MNLLDVHNLTVRFGSTVVVDDVSFSVAAGEKFALVGESGSGKTVSALSILRLNQDAHYDGRILFNGDDVLQKSENAMRQVRGNDAAMIFQEPMTALNPLFTIGSDCRSVDAARRIEHQGGGATYCRLAGKTVFRNRRGGRWHTRINCRGASASAR